MTRIQQFLSSPTISPTLAGIGAGLYPLFFYYSNNYALINSWNHLGFFIVLFLIIPIVFFWLCHIIFKKFGQKWKLKTYVFFNISAFLSFIALCLYAGVKLGLFAGALGIGAFFAAFLSKHFKKFVLIQLVLAIINLFWLVPTIFEQLNYNDSWIQQPDNIEEAVFTKKPNVYYIQPDGYVNFSELNKGYYKLRENPHQGYLEGKDFELYPDIRSNYTSTVISNAATFMMKHHYYNYGFNFTEITNGRQIIMSDNPVLKIFKNNGYKTHFISELPYLLANKPKIGYDKCNFNESNISYITNGFKGKQNVLDSLGRYLKEDIDKPKFFFIQIFKPGHVPSKKEEAKGHEGDKELWVQNLELSNQQQQEVIDTILATDPNALIMIMSDHGGYLGWENMMGIRTKTEDEMKLRSAFSTNLAIKWPDKAPPNFDTRFKSGVNVFRILFSYLSDDLSYLENLQDESSYTIIQYGAPKGIYKVLDANGKMVFEKRNK